MKAWKNLAASLGLALGSTASSGVAADMLSERALWSDPAARAYLSLGFGAGSGQQDSPLHAGLRIDRDSSLQWTQAEPVARVDFDRSGLTEATLNGVPMVARDPVVYQQDGDIIYNWTDWAVLAAGAAGLGFIIFEVADNEDDEELQPVDDGNGDGDGGNGGDDGGGGGLLGGLLGFQAEDTGTLSASEYRAWMDGGTGQMGDLD
jgi:hypothetical protein